MLFGSFAHSESASHSTEPKDGAEGKSRDDIFSVNQPFPEAFSKKCFQELVQEKSLPWSRDVVYCFLSSPGINWRWFLLTATKRIIERFLYPFISEKRTDVFILDDSFCSCKMKLRALYGTVKDTLEKKDILGSAEVFVDAGKNTEEAPVPAGVVFARNRTEGARCAWLALLTTNMVLADKDVVRIYGKRWRIEVFFKSAKSLLRLAKEFQTRSYDSLTAHTSFVFLRQMMLCFVSSAGRRTTAHSGRYSAAVAKNLRTSRSRRPSDCCSSC